MKQFVIFTIGILQIIFCGVSYSQPWLWAKSGNGSTWSAQDFTNSVSTDVNGNVFATGQYYGSSITFGSITLIGAGGLDAFIIKYDANGNVLWAKSVGGIADDYGFSVSTDANGNVFVAGLFESPTITFGSIVLTNTSSANDDMFIVKYDSNGNVLWAKSGSAGSNSEGTSVSTDSNGNVFLTGMFNSSNISFGSTTLTNAGGFDLFITKYDANGNVLWVKSAGGSSDDDSWSVSTDKNGNVFVAGDFFSPILSVGTTTLTNAGWNDIFIAKYDASGNFLWAKSVGGSSYDFGSSVSSDPSGNVFLTGRFESPAITFGSTILTNTHSMNMYISKYDANGNVLWAKSAGGTSSSDGTSVSADAGGNVFLTGNFSDTITIGLDTLSYPAAGYPIYIAKYDSNGNVVCASALESGGYGWVSVSVDPFGEAYIGGGFNINPFIIGKDTLHCAYGGPNNSSVFVAKYICICSNSTAIVTGNTTICSGKNDVLTAINSGGVNYLWNTGQTTSSITISPTTNSIYSVIIPVGSCMDTASTTVVVNQSPTANVSVSTNATIFQGQSITLSATGGGNYLWNNGATDSVISEMPMTTTLYCVTVSNPKGCTDTSCVTVRVESPCDTAGAFFFPNAFSPNNDGENDALKVYYNEMNCIATLHLIIYDRWGEMVFETTDKNFSWDGAYPNKPLNTQVLAYHLTVGFTDGKAINRKGNISLVR